MICLLLDFFLRRSRHGRRCERYAGQFRLGHRVKGGFDEGSYLPLNFKPRFLVIDLAADGVVDASDEFDDFGLSEGFGGAFGEAAGVSAFEQPGGGPPVAAGVVVEHIHRRDLGPDERLPQLFVKLGIAAGLAADGQDAAAGIASGRLEGAAAGEHGDDFVLFGVGEESWSGHGRVEGPGLRVEGKVTCVRLYTPVKRGVQRLFLATIGMDHDGTTGAKRLAAKRGASGREKEESRRAVNSLGRPNG
jgi:hypothetical protein